MVLEFSDALSNVFRCKLNPMSCLVSNGIKASIDFIFLLVNLDQLGGHISKCSFALLKEILSIGFIVDLKDALCRLHDTRKLLSSTCKKLSAS